MHCLIHGQETIHEPTPHTDGCHMDVPPRNPVTPMDNVPSFDLKVQVHMMVIETFARFYILQ